MPRGLILKIDPQSPDAALIERAALALSAGGLVIIPTETLYGIAADSANSHALTRLAKLKTRPKDKPFPLIVSSSSHLEALVAEVSPLAQELMAKYWPGPLSLILASRWGLPLELVYNGGVAVRHSSHPVPLSIADYLGRAITATSANLAGKQAKSTVDDLDPQVIDAVDIVLDAGPCPGGPPSTLADVRVDPPIVLRKGSISL